MDKVTGKNADLRIFGSVLKEYLAGIFGQQIISVKPDNPVSDSPLNSLIHGVRQPFIPLGNPSDALGPLENLHRPISRTTIDHPLFQLLCSHALAANRLEILQDEVFAVK